MFQLALAVIRPVTKSTSLFSNFEIEHKQVLDGDEQRPRRLTLDMITDVMVPTQGPSENVGKGTVKALRCMLMELEKKIKKFRRGKSKEADPRVSEWV
jgi:hypothetical protein